MEPSTSVPEAQPQQKGKRKITLADYELPPKRTRSRTQALSRESTLPQESSATIASQTNYASSSENKNTNVLPLTQEELKPSTPKPTGKAMISKGTKGTNTQDVNNKNSTTKTSGTKNNARTKGTSTKSSSTKRVKNAVNSVASNQRDTAPPANSFLAKEARYALNGDKSNRLMQLPPPKYRYVDARGRLLFNSGDMNHTKPRTEHPTLLEARERGVPARAKELWFDGVPHHIREPVAGVPSSGPYNPKLPRPSGTPLFGAIVLRYFPTQWLEKEDANRPIQEDAFHSRPSIKIVVTDVLKALLVDDWENITKNMQLVPIPHSKPVTKILEDYAAYETPKRPAGSSQIDILEETLAGLKEYFDKSLGRILLYRFERVQYADIHKKWASDPDFEGKAASDIYGAEHLLRLIVTLPELIAQTNMDQQSVNRLREELSKFCAWLSKNATEYFVSNYETPTTEYVQSAKN
ncbi:MRG-domain-containing protein [Camillea tinctor]|nr:MRG-domain-containing protein [Camillea tinctor]